MSGTSPLTRTIQPLTDDVPLQRQATSRHKGPLRVKQRPSNCAFEQAAWSVSWWLLAPPGPAVLQIGSGPGRCTGKGIRKQEASRFLFRLISRWILFLKSVFQSRRFHILCDGAGQRHRKKHIGVNMCIKKQSICRICTNK